MKAPNLAPPGDTDYLVLYGSHAHGTATATSDEDWRGVYRLPNDAFLGLDTPPRTWTAAPDVVMWELGHFCQLLLGGNPNIVEELKKGKKLGDRDYKVHLDGYNQLDMLTGKGVDWIRWISAPPVRIRPAARPAKTGSMTVYAMCSNNIVTE